MVYIRLKDSVLDPQGKAVLGGLRDLGFADVADVKVGKMIELYMGDVVAGERTTEPPEVLKERVRQMCQKLLVNTVIEEFHFEVVW
ncbi:Phosphoribosylformylglycinamidine synthetase, PurS subunit [Candidatus Magnetobacterium bavaricum]|uniref:Phosphoribosylformylglycinamidine synthase subunit PurS n=1 Tax=Candidatus Magnetobacterium bavaricum TaxID=29290 RepID=A0A0F3GW56_9BACT|nr:Phosphoribosylformylglycinamidine synthetase, PurS subunit [Candidatus Magnetobacterium bavaricum]